MSMTVNGTSPTSVNYNGSAVEVIVVDGVEVWRHTPPFLVRLRYDANQATHVKDLAGGGHTISISGSTPPAAADPFGGNNAINLDSATIEFTGANAIVGTTSTVTAWVKPRNNAAAPLLCNQTYGSRSNRVVGWSNAKPHWIFNQVGSPEVACDSAMSLNTWHFLEYSSDGTLLRIFVDGIKQAEGEAALATSYPNWKNANGTMWIGNFPYNNRKLKGDIYDFCILNGVWHTNNYVVPTGYI